VLESEGLVVRAAKLGHELGVNLRYYNLSQRVHGTGFVWAVWMSDNPRYDPVAIEKANMVVELAAARGLLLLKTGAGTVKIGPPLMIERDTLLDGLQILESCIREVI
jgi:4-aminobutyrate aminotransferase-like enzyme